MRGGCPGSGLREFEGYRFFRDFPPGRRTRRGEPLARTGNSVRLPQPIQAEADVPARTAASPGDYIGRAIAAAAM